MEQEAGKWNKYREDVQILPPSSVNPKINLQIHFYDESTWFLYKIFTISKFSRVGNVKDGKNGINIVWDVQILPPSFVSPEIN